MHALVVDDEKLLRIILRRILENLGFEVSEAADGFEALARLEELGAVDVALVDWRMPGMSGLDFVRAVRAQRAYDGMRLMMVTTKTEVSEVQQALEAGVDEYLMKPFTREAIAEKLLLLGIEPA